MQSIIPPFGSAFTLHGLHAAAKQCIFCLAPEILFVPSVFRTRCCRTAVVDPEGGAQEVRRFSMRQDASSKNPGDAAGGNLDLDLNVFFGYFLCAKESDSRTSAKKPQALPVNHHSPAQKGPREFRRRLRKIAYVMRPFWQGISINHRPFDSDMRQHVGPGPDLRNHSVV